MRNRKSVDCPRCGRPLMDDGYRWIVGTGEFTEHGHMEGDHIQTVYEYPRGERIYFFLCGWCSYKFEARLESVEADMEIKP